MNSSQWMTCREPDDMLAILLQRGVRHGNRKFPLFACGCCRLSWNLLVDQRIREAVEVAERLADGRAGSEKVGEARAKALHALVPLDHRGARAKLARVVIRLLSRETNFEGMALGIVNMIRAYSRSPRLEAIAAAHCDLIRDLFGNPFEPQVFDPAWLTPTVVDLSRGIYDRRDYEKMPFLGDALEEAGCANPGILEHCRTGPVHARGCWVVDALTGRARA